MKIGIVSDLHGRMPESLHAVFAGCDRILCAGDVEREQILWELQTIAPVINVRGNNDWAVEAPPSATLTLAGVKFFMVHRPQDIGVVAPDVAVVVHGHTHIPRNEVIGGVRYINPGSTTYPRGGSDASVALAWANDGVITRVELVQLPWEAGEDDLW